jgi:hypothetical protein
MLKALRDEHQLSMLTFDVRLRFGACSRFYTTLRVGRFRASPGAAGGATAYRSGAAVFSARYLEEI